MDELPLEEVELADAGGVAAALVAAAAVTGAAAVVLSSASAATDHTLITRTTGTPGVKRFMLATRLSILKGMTQATRKLNERQPR